MYREQNKQQLNMFSPSRTLGFKTKVYVDPGHNCFVVSKSSNYKNDNADIINLSQVTGARSETKEHKKELYQKDSQGHSVSYNPRRYEYSYEIFVTINVNSPYFNEIKFEVTDNPIANKGSNEFMRYQNEADLIVAAVTGRAPAGMAQPGMGQQAMGQTGGVPGGIAGAVAGVAGVAGLAGIAGALLGNQNNQQAQMQQQNMMNQQMQQQNMMNQQAYGQQGFNNQGMMNNQQGYAQQGFGNQQGYAQQGFAQQGFNNQGMMNNQQGYAQQGFAQQGFGGQWVCPNCGMTNTANFCQNCGAQKQF